MTEAGWPWVHRTSSRILNKARLYSLVVVWNDFTDQWSWLQNREDTLIQSSSPWGKEINLTCFVKTGPNWKHSAIAI